MPPQQGCVDGYPSVQEAYKEDDQVMLLSHTVMPVTDTVPVLQNYARVNHVVSGKWHPGLRRATADRGPCDFKTSIPAVTQPCRV